MSDEPPARGLSRALARVPAPALFATSGIAQYSGAALAVGLFALMPPHTVAWARALVSAVILLVLIRPWRTPWTRATLRQTGLFGVVLVVMNMLFYIAIHYLPLGAVVAIEFAGPALVAAWGSRSARGRVAVALAAAGVAAISLVGLRWDEAGVGGTAPMVLGLLCAVAAGATWAWYMVLAGRIAAVRDGQASLAVGTSIAVVLLAPLAAPWAGPLLTSGGSIWLAVLGVGVLSSVIPYILDQVAIVRLGTATFALLNALLPATATVVGLLALQQQPTIGEIAGLLAISVAVALAPRRRALGPDGA
ncbi:EamA family transporter [Pseudactinotalea suaedae]|uniref:EamA family transporter n=1 Tax=Pseudactinotalea suaedae TaxID=1524924 RepID=UPI001F4FAFB6|nr:EamA family transporter [Pseudactinotalea suaedae]